MQACRSRLAVLGVDHLRVSLSLLPSPFLPDAASPRVNPAGVSHVSYMKLTSLPTTEPLSALGGGGGGGGVTMTLYRDTGTYTALHATTS